MDIVVIWRANTQIRIAEKKLLHYWLLVLHQTGQQTGRGTREKAAVQGAVDEDSNCVNRINIQREDRIRPAQRSKSRRAELFNVTGGDGMHFRKYGPRSVHILYRQWKKRFRRRSRLNLFTRIKFNVQGNRKDQTRRIRQVNWDKRSRRRRCNI